MWNLHLYSRSYISSPAISRPAFSVPHFLVLHFPPCILIPHFPVLHFPLLHFPLLHFWSCIFQSCIFRYFIFRSRIFQYCILVPQTWHHCSLIFRSRIFRAPFGIGSYTLRIVLTFTITKFSQKLELVTELQPVLIILFTLFEVLLCTVLGSRESLQSQPELQFHHHVVGIRVCTWIRPTFAWAFVLNHNVVDLIAMVAIKRPPRILVPWVALVCRISRR